MSTPRPVQRGPTAGPDEAVGSTADWETPVADSWGAIDDYEPAVFVDRIRTLVAELPAGNAIGLFELGCAQDSTGHPDLAVPLYRAALGAGLAGIRRRRATSQLASSLRNLGASRHLAVLRTSSVRVQASAPRARPFQAGRTPVVTTTTAAHVRPEYALVVAPFAGTVAAALVIVIAIPQLLAAWFFFVEPKSPFGIATLVAAGVTAAMFNALFFRRVAR